MAKKTLNSCRTANDFVRYAQRNGADVVDCKKGVKIYGDRPDQYAVIHSNHPRELATGTRSALVKALISIGIAGSVGCAWIYQAMVAMQL